MPRAREHSRELTKAFGPVRLFLILIGQMPFEIKHKEDGTVSFKFKRFGKFTLLFGLVFFISTLNYLLVCVGIITFFTRRTFKLEQEKTILVQRSAGPTLICDPNMLTDHTTKWELYYIQRELVTIAVIWSWMTISIVGSSYVLFHGRYYVHYFNYWNKVVQGGLNMIKNEIMNMDVTAGIQGYLIYEILSFATVIVALIILFVVPGIDIISDTAAVIANFYFRTFKIEIAANYDNPVDSERTDFLAYRALGFLIIIYGYAGSRANIIQFLFFVRCLTNASKIWNERLKQALTKQGMHELTPQEITAQRLEHRLILKDHYVLVQLFKMTDNLFSRILLTYYSLQIMTVVLELYQLATLRSTVEDILPHLTRCNNSVINGTTTMGTTTTTQIPPFFRDENAARKEFSDWNRSVQSAGVVLVLLAQGIVFAILATRSAGKAYEEAMNGFQILRRSNYLSCDSKSERNFVHSLIFSYARNNPLNVTAGGYFIIDKTLIPSLVGTVLNYVVAVYTLQPDRRDAWNEDMDVIVSNTTTTMAPVPSTTSTIATTTTTATTFFPLICDNSTLPLGVMQLFGNCTAILSNLTVVTLPNGTVGR